MPAVEEVASPRSEWGRRRSIYGLQREGALPPDPSGETRRRCQRLATLHLPDVASEVRLGHARCVRARCRSLSLGYKVRGPGTEKALSIWALHAPLHGPARLGCVALLRASGDMGWRMVPSRQAYTYRVGHSRCGLGLRALA